MTPQESMRYEHYLRGRREATEEFIEWLELELIFKNREGDYFSKLTEYGIALIVPKKIEELRSKWQLK